MKEMIFFFLFLIFAFFMVEVIATIVPGWIIAGIFFGLIVYGMAKLTQYAINMNR